MLGPLCKGKRLPQHHVAANTHRKTGSGRRGYSYGNGLQAASEHTSISLQKPEGTARPLPMALDFLPASLAAAPQSTLLGPLTLPEAGGPGLASPLSPLAICSLGDPSLFCGLIHVIYGEKGPTISSPAVTSFLGLRTPTFNCLLENPTQMSQR